MTSNILPSVEDVLEFGSKHNPDVWSKHRAFIEDPSPFDKVLSFCSEHRSKFKRKHVFDIARADRERGIIASVVWGFPRGGRPGGQYKSFAQVFAETNRFADHIESIGSGNTGAAEGLQGLNSLLDGVGFATTSKLAYFADVQFLEGPALIFDANVIKAITSNDGVWSDAFRNTREMLGVGSWYHRAAKSYGVYVAEARDLAKRSSEKLGVPVEPHQIETALFLHAVKPGVWS
jgi:Putative 8-oxoguanine DNA glycosylase OGG-like protein